LPGHLMCGTIAVGFLFHPEHISDSTPTQYEQDRRAAAKRARVNENEICLLRSITRATKRTNSTAEDEEEERRND